MKSQYKLHIRIHFTFSKVKAGTGAVAPIVNKVGRRIHPKQNEVQNSILLLLFHRPCFIHRHIVNFSNDSWFWNYFYTPTFSRIRFYCCYFTDFYTHQAVLTPGRQFFKWLLILELFSYVLLRFHEFDSTVAISQTFIHTVFQMTLDSGTIFILLHFHEIFLQCFRRLLSLDFFHAAFSRNIPCEYYVKILITSLNDWMSPSIFFELYVDLLRSWGIFDFF